MLLLIGVAFTVLSTKLSGGEPSVFGTQFKTVLSGSMEPGIQTGSVIAIQKDSDTTNYVKNDVITFQDDNILITHRITEVIKNEGQTAYRTKGDNNDGEDPNPVRSENVVGHYIGVTIPYLGYFINFSQSKNGAFLLLIPGFLLVGYSFVTAWRMIDEMDDEKKNDNKQLDEDIETNSRE